MSTNLFLFGTLCHLPLLRIVLGRDPDAQDATLADFAAYWVQGQPFPMITAEPGGQAQGILLQGLSQEDLDRIVFYEAGFDYDLVPVQVAAAGASHPAVMFQCEEGRWPRGAIWSLADWAARWGAISEGAARDVMARRDTHSTAQIAGMLPFFRARAWAQELSATPAPQTLRNPMTVQDVQILPDTRPAYNGFFNMEPFTLRYRHFNGGFSKDLQRECFMAFDVALLLPYDPVLDLVLFVEQLRYGPIKRGDPAPWILEPVAGLVDAGESPEQAAQREADEEAGLKNLRLEKMVAGYSSPGYSTEFYHCYLGQADLSDLAPQGHGGIAAENEDIRTHVLSFSRAMDLLDSGEINAAPLAMMLLWLARHRDRLRSAARAPEAVG